MGLKFDIEAIQAEFDVAKKEKLSKDIKVNKAVVVEVLSQVETKCMDAAKQAKNSVIIHVVPCEEWCLPRTIGKYPYELGGASKLIWNSLKNAGLDTIVDFEYLTRNGYYSKYLTIRVKFADEKGILD